MVGKCIHKNNGSRIRQAFTKYDRFHRAKFSEAEDLRKKKRKNRMLEMAMPNGILVPKLVTMVNW